MQNKRHKGKNFKYAIAVATGVVAGAIGFFSGYVYSGKDLLTSYVGHEIQLKKSVSFRNASGTVLTIPKDAVLWYESDYEMQQLFILYLYSYYGDFENSELGSLLDRSRYFITDEFSESATAPQLKQ